MIRHFLTLILAALALQVSTLGQEAKRISFRLLCVKQVDGIDALLAPAIKGEPQEVILYTGGFSPEVTAAYPSNKAFLFAEETGADGKVVPKVLAEGNLANSPRQVFILIPTGKKTGPIYQILAFDDREESFPMGATRVINLANFPIRLNLAGADLEPISPGKVEVYPQVTNVDDWNMYSARIDFGLEDGKWVAVSNQSWQSNGGKRDWVIASFDPKTRQPVINRFKDQPPWRSASPQR